MDVGVIACHGQSKTDHGKTYKPKSYCALTLVTGELKSNPIVDGQDWLDLATYREVFRKQERWFVPAFLTQRSQPQSCGPERALPSLLPYT